MPAAPASAQTLTRIETQAHYGAVVTIERGVRVYRPLPATGHMIINPGGRTPLNLSYTNVNVVGDAAPVVAEGTISGAGTRSVYGWGGPGLRRYGALRHHPGLIRVGHGKGTLAFGRSHARTMSRGMR